MNLIVTGGWGYGNIGDEAIASTTIFLLDKYFPKYNKIYFSYSTSEFRRHHGLNALRSIHSLIEKDVNSTENLKQYIENFIGRDNEFSRCLSAGDILFMSGGGYITGGWTDQIISRIIEILVAKKRGAKVFLVGQSIGPIYDSQLRDMMIYALKQVDYIAVRDNSSLEYLGACGIDNVRVIPDLAILVSDIYPRRDNTYEICAMTAGYTKYQSMTAHGEAANPFIRVLGKVVNRYYLINYKKGIDALMKYSSHQGKLKFILSTDWKYDARYTSKIIGDNNIKNCEVIKHATVRELCENISECSFMISSKMHPLIIATSYEIPTLGISYNYKMDDFMAMIGRRDSCIDNYSFDLSRCKKMIQQENKKRVDANLIAELKKQVYDTFKDLSETKV